MCNRIVTGVLHTDYFTCVAGDLSISPYTTMVYIGMDKIDSIFHLEIESDVEKSKGFIFYEDVE